MDDYTLLITTVGHVISSIAFAVVAVLVLLHNPTKTLNRAFFVSAIAASVFGLDLAFAINLDPGPFAYRVWMLNLIDVLIVSAYLHMTFAAIQKEHEARWLLRGVYAVGALIVGASLLFPHLFLPEVVPKLFTKSYLVAGPLYVAMVVYFVVVFLMSFFSIIYGYLRQKENRRQLEYFILAAIIGYSTGPIDFFLVFDINVSPLYGMFFGFFMLPIAYGIITDQLMDIRIAFKRALLYSFGIASIAGTLAVLIFINDFLVRTFAWIQFWTVPIFAAIISFIIGRVFWSKMVENEKIKYEFITVATHKLRTPLTQIHWGLSSLVNESLSPQAKDLVEHIRHANGRLIELTNILFETTEEAEMLGRYSRAKEKIGLLAITRDVFRKLDPIIKKKKLVVNIHADTEVTIVANPQRITSVIEVLIENAVNYTPEGGLVQVITYTKSGRAVYSVRDTGIGVPPKEQKLIFSRFYRTDAARRADTEGVGLGLAMAKSIIEKNGGKIGVESQGENKGSTFWFSLPAPQNGSTDRGSDDAA